MQKEELNPVRVVDQPTALQLVGLSLSTWERMRRRGETPPITQISDRRIGYRISDLEKVARRAPRHHRLKAKPPPREMAGALLFPKGG